MSIIVAAQPGQLVIRDVHFFNTLLWHCFEALRLQYIVCGSSRSSSTAEMNLACIMILYSKYLTSDLMMRKLKKSGFYHSIAATYSQLLNFEQ